MDNSIAAWEDDGGSQAGSVELTGTINPMDWAVQIRRQVDAEFDRVRGALEAIGRRRPLGPLQRRTEIGVLIAVLEEKRAEVLRRLEAGYVIHDWREIRNHVRRLILEDPRCKVIPW